MSNTISIISSLIISSSICLSILSSIWYYTAKDLKSKRMCTTNKDFDKWGKEKLGMDNFSVLYCPLNQEMVAYSIYKDEKDYYYSKNYLVNYNRKYDNNEITPLDYFNTYFSGGIAPPLTGVDYRMYCNPTITMCGKTSSDLNVTITEDIVYKGMYKDKIYFYCDPNLLFEITQKTYKSLNTFLNDCSKYSNKIDICSSITSEEDKKTKTTSCIFYGNNFFEDSTTVISTFSKTILRGLNDDLLKKYLDILESKINIDQNITTFELFVYLAIKLKLDNVKYLILKKSN